MHSIDVPQWNWEHMAMDFVTHLTHHFLHFYVLWVVFDWFSKWDHFISFDRMSPYKKTTHLYAKNEVRLHGVPTMTVSDHGPRLTSKFWTILQKEICS